MKKIICLILAVLTAACFSSCSLSEKKSGVSAQDEPKKNYTYVKAVWISYYELGEILSDTDKNAAEQKLGDVFKKIADFGFNTVFVHMRGNSDAFYNSKYFPLSSYIKNIDYDPLQLITETAHKLNISVHAWINPYRVAMNKKISDLSSDYPAKKWYDNAETDKFIICGENIYYNPASPEVQKLVIDGVREIVRNYDVDGIHFDDYFYPSTDKRIDEASYSAYKASGGRLSLGDFRRENVNALVSGVYAAVKEVNKNVVFGISPQADPEKNKNQLYADVEYWVKHQGYIDYIAPQIYFGFENEASPFEETAAQWQKLVENSGKKLYCGLALYKSGQTDDYASSNHTDPYSAYYEWQNNSDIIVRQIACINRYGFSGYAVFSYHYIFDANGNKNLLKERDSLKEKQTGSSET